MPQAPKPFNSRSRIALVIVLLIVALMVLAFLVSADTWRDRVNPTAPQPPPPTLDPAVPPATP